MDFEFENVGEEGFIIRGNGMNYGFFFYGDVLVMVGLIVFVFD